MLGGTYRGEKGERRGREKGEGGRENGGPNRTKVTVFETSVVVFGWVPWTIIYTSTLVRVYGEEQKERKKEERKKREGREKRHRGMRLAGALPSSFYYEIEMDRQTGSEREKGEERGEEKRRRKGRGKTKNQVGHTGKFDDIYPSNHTILLSRITSAGKTSQGREGGGKRKKKRGKKEKKGGRGQDDIPTPRTNHPFATSFQFDITVNIREKKEERKKKKGGKRSIPIHSWKHNVF